MSHSVVGSSLVLVVAFHALEALCSNNPLVSSCKQDVPAGCVGLRECHDARGPPPRLPMRPCQGGGERQGQRQERELRVDSYTPYRARYVVRREREFRTSMEYMFSGPACCLIEVLSSEIEIFEHMNITERSKLASPNVSALDAADGQGRLQLFPSMGQQVSCYQDQHSCVPVCSLLHVALCKSMNIPLESIHS